MPWTSGGVDARPGSTTIVAGVITHNQFDWTSNLFRISVHKYMICSFAQNWGWLEHYIIPSWALKDCSLPMVKKGPSRVLGKTPVNTFQNHNACDCVCEWPLLLSSQRYHKPKRRPHRWPGGSVRQQIRRLQQERPLRHLWLGCLGGRGQSRLSARCQREQRPCAPCHNRNNRSVRQSNSFLLS